MRAYVFVGLSAALVAVAACVGDDNPINTDGGADVTTNNDTGTNDTGTTNDAQTSDGSDAAAFLPSSFGVGLVLWLEGDVGLSLDDAGAVASWQDQSLYPVTMSGTALTDLTPNGHVVVNFNATNVNVSTASVSKLELGATDDFIIAAVMQTTSGSNGPPGAYAFFKAQIAGFKPSAHLGDGFVFGTDVDYATTNAPQIWDYTDGLDAGVNFTSSKNFDDGNYHVAIARRIGGTSIHVKMSGLEEITTLPQPIDISQSAQPLSVGNVFWGELFSGTFAFKLAELVVVRRSGSFTVQESGALESYLKTKYAAN